MANPEKCREARRKWVNTNQKRYHAYQRLWRKSAKRKAWLRGYNKTKKACEYQRQWRQAHPVEIRHRYASRRMRTKSKPTEPCNVLAQLISDVRNLKCGICGKRMSVKDRTLDHIIPLSKGGSPEIWNLRIVHMRCNSSKGATMTDELNFTQSSL